MKYKYYIFIVLPGKDLLETSAKIEVELNKWGAAGWMLYRMNMLNEIVGVLLNGSPKVETRYQIILQKQDNGKTD